MEHGHHRQGHKDLALDRMRKYAEARKWLSECPFDDGTPFYEAASNMLASYSGLIEHCLEDVDIALYRRWIEIISGMGALLGEDENEWEQKAIAKLIRDTESTS